MFPLCVFADDACVATQDMHLSEEIWFLQLAAWILPLKMPMGSSQLHKSYIKNTVTLCLHDRGWFVMQLGTRLYRQCASWPQVRVELIVKSEMSWMVRLDSSLLGISAHTVMLQLEFHPKAFSPCTQSHHIAKICDRSYKTTACTANVKACVIPVLYQLVW